MAIRQIKKKPETPAAHLYMEDIEEIISVLTDVEQKKRQQRKEPDDNVDSYFIVKNRECDTIEDLKKLGGKWRSFEASVGYSTFRVTPIGTWIRVSSENNGHQRILEIMRAREIKLRTSLSVLPLWVVLLFVILLDIALRRIVPQFKWAEVVRWTILLLVLGFYFWESTAHTVVELRYSHEKTPKWKSIGEAASKGIWIILGVILAELGHLLWEYLTKHK